MRFLKEANSTCSSDFSWDSLMEVVLGRSELGRLWLVALPPVRAEMGGGERPPGVMSSDSSLGGGGVVCCTRGGSGGSGGSLRWDCWVWVGFLQPPNTAIKFIILSHHYLQIF